MPPSHACFAADRMRLPHRQFCTQFICPAAPPTRAHATIYPLRFPCNTDHGCGCAYTRLRRRTERLRTEGAEGNGGGERDKTVLQKKLNGQSMGGGQQAVATQPAGSGRLG